MNISVFNSIMGTIDSCPYAPRSKQIVDPGTAMLAGPAMLAGAGVSLLGNVLGFGSSQNANSTNLELARLNNEHQYKMFKEQNAFNLDMWNKNNAYNDPSKNVERLLAAGINPSAVYGNASTTPASQIQSATAPQLQRADVRPFVPDFDGVGHAVNAYFDNQMKSKAAESTGIDNQIKMVDLQYKAMHHLGDLMEQKHRIDKIISDSNLNKDQQSYLREQSEYLGLQIQKFKDNYEVMSEREKLQNDVMRAQQGSLLADASLKRAQSQFQSIVTSYYPSVTDSQLAVMTAQVGNIMQDTANKVKEGKLTSFKQISQDINNQLDQLELVRSMNKQGVGKHPLFGKLKGFSDYLGGLILDNLRLFK